MRSPRLAGLGVPVDAVLPPARRASSSALRGVDGRFGRVGTGILSPSHALWQFYGPLREAFLQSAQADARPELPTFAFLLLDEERSRWETTAACPDLYRSLDWDLDYQISRGTSEADVKSICEQRYGPTLDFLGRMTTRYRRGVFPLGRDALLRPPGPDPRRIPGFPFPRPGDGAGPSSSIGWFKANAKVLVTLRGYRQWCITLDASKVASSKRVVWRDSGYYSVRIARARHPEPDRAVRLERAHRIVLWCVFGPPPQEKWRHALHMCGNPRCINPEHLVWGSLEDNAIEDPVMARKAFVELLKAQDRLPAS